MQISQGKTQNFLARRQQATEQATAGNRQATGSDLSK